MTLPLALQKFRERPLMYISNETFGEVVAFISGFDVASHGGTLGGFREWLIVKFDGGNNLSWSALVLDCFALQQPGAGKLVTASDNLAAIAYLFETLDQFMNEQRTPEGVRRVYVRYQQWLRRQSWYGPKSVDWIDEG